MLTIQIPGEEYWDADREEFICRKATTLALEHSLLSLCLNGKASGTCRFSTQKTG